MGKTRKWKVREKRGGPDYLGAWNRLLKFKDNTKHALQKHQNVRGSEAVSDWESEESIFSIPTMVKLAFAFIAAVVLCFCGSYAGNLLPEELDSLTHFKYGNLKDQRSRSEAPHEEDAEFQDDNFKDYDGSKEEQG